MHGYAVFALIMGALLVLFHPHDSAGYALVIASVALVAWAQLEKREKRLDERYAPPFVEFPPTPPETYRVVNQGGWVWRDYENGRRVLIGPAPEERRGNGDES